MNKKKKITVILITLILLLIVSKVIIKEIKFRKKYNELITEYDKRKYFNINDYQEIIKKFPSEEFIEDTSNYNNLKENANKIFKNIWQDFNDKDYLKISIEEDTINKAYHIYYELPSYSNSKDDILGGGPHLIVLDNGKVLAVWHTK